MKLGVAYPLVAAGTLLGAAAGYTEISRTAAHLTDTGVHAGEAGATRATAGPAVESPALTGNPLWAVALEQLSITRERPVFSPSRRPSPPPAVTPAYVAPIAPQPLPAEPERLAISLVGTVASKTVGIGVFIEPATRNIVRLRVGDDHQGWVLRSVKGREATLEKDSKTTVLELAPPDATTTTATATPSAPDQPRARRQPRG
jgi:hypothetical protein